MKPVILIASEIWPIVKFLKHWTVTCDLEARSTSPQVTKSLSTLVKLSIVPSMKYVGKKKSLRYGSLKNKRIIKKN